jgi:hydroxymethylpyrimidine/phosphomethylpyrimidine kinase
MDKIKNYHTVLSIAGSDSGGGAGIQADIKTISSLGCYAMTAITALTAQNTLGVQDVHGTSAEFVAKQIRSILSDIRTDAIKIGMLFDTDIVQAVTTSLTSFQETPIILDPVMVATSGDLLISKEAVEVLVKELVPLCEIITPNIHEAGVLAGLKVTTLEDMKGAAIRIADFGIENVLIKGGDRKARSAVDILYSSDTGRFEYFEESMIETQNTHGTGCSLSSAIASYRAKGNDIVESIRLSKEFIHGAIKTGKDYQLGGGKGPIHHFWNYLL